MLVLDEVDKLLSDNFKIIVAKIIELMPEEDKFLSSPLLIQLLSELSNKSTFQTQNSST